jgi:hypothetical protein
LFFKEVIEKAYPKDLTRFTYRVVMLLKTSITNAQQFRILLYNFSLLVNLKENHLKTGAKECFLSLPRKITQKNMRVILQGYTISYATEASQ